MVDFNAETIVKMAIDIIYGTSFPGIFGFAEACVRRDFAGTDRGCTRIRNK